MSDRACTCHPSEAPKPCQKRYAMSECQAARIEKLEAALRPFADALKGNWSRQPDYMTITAGPHGRDLRVELLLGHFREARAALEEKP